MGHKANECDATDVGQVDEEHAEVEAEVGGIQFVGAVDALVPDRFCYEDFWKGSPTEGEMAMQRRGLSNYERFFKLPSASVTLEQAMSSSAGVVGWAAADLIEDAQKIAKLPIELEE